MVGGPQGYGIFLLKKGDAEQKLLSMTFFVGESIMKGFTLIELLVVVLIIGILAAVALPQYEFAVYKSRFAKIQPLVNSLVAAQEIYYMANGKYSEDLAELDVDYPSSCKYEQTSQTQGWEYDRLDCPDVLLQLSLHYYGIRASVKNCPVAREGCALYMVPYQGAHPLMGSGPSCRPYGEEGSSVYQYGERVCQSAGGRKETNNWGVFYYL